MYNCGIFFLFLGLLGFAWTLFGSMFVSLFFGSFERLYILQKKKNINFDDNLSFEILIAAYNEEKTILQSLKSYEKCFEYLKHLHSHVSLSIHVGLDHCTDNSIKIVQEFKSKTPMGCRYTENDGERGKWHILKKLIMQSSADWVSLTDCGSLWDSRLINEIEKLLRDESVACIAPSYLPINAKLLESTYWRTEQLIRTIENLGGGSIMVHGLSVFYRRKDLLVAIEKLGVTHWFNDDVAIPLAMRLFDSNKKITYFASLSPQAWVRDIGVVSDVNIELKRRKRILMGNLQIIKFMILPNFEFTSLASWASLRLLFKSLWAYWATFTIVGFVLLVFSSELFKNLLNNQNPATITVETIILFSILFIIRKSNYLHRLLMAYLSGLWIFKGWSDLKQSKKISWS